MNINAQQVIPNAYMSNNSNKQNSFKIKCSVWLTLLHLSWSAITVLKKSTSLFLISSGLKVLNLMLFNFSSQFPFTNVNSHVDI